MMEEVFCWNCDKLFEVNVDEYWETEQENTFDIKFCPECNAPNCLSYSMHASFHTSEPNDVDKKDYNYIFEDNKERLE